MSQSWYGAQKYKYFKLGFWYTHRPSCCTSSRVKAPMLDGCSASAPDTVISVLHVGGVCVLSSTTMTVYVPMVSHAPLA